MLVVDPVDACRSIDEAQNFPLQLWMKNIKTSHQCTVQISQATKYLVSLLSHRPCHLT
jgi:hypothetical protein